MSHARRSHERNYIRIADREFGYSIIIYDARPEGNSLNGNLNVFIPGHGQRADLYISRVFEISEEWQDE